MIDNSDCLVERHEGSETFFNFSLGDYLKHKMYHWGELRYDAADLRKRTHTSPSTLHCLNRAYPHAIEISKPVPELSKWRMGVAIFIFIAMVLIWAFVYFNDHALGDTLHWTVLITLLPVYLGLFTIWWAYRFNNSELGNQTLMFNRKTCQVIVYQVHEPSFFKFWDFGKAEIKKLPWKNIRVRIYKCFEGKGEQYIILAMFWSQKKHPGKLKDMVRLYRGSYLDNNNYLFRLWEYIRQYMEEHGPPVPSGEVYKPDLTEPSPFPKRFIRKAGGKAYSPQKWQSISAEKWS